MRTKEQQREATRRYRERVHGPARLREYSPHLDRDWLYEKYTDEKLSTYDIGRIVGRDPKNIYDKLVQFGIPTRPRGENLHNVTGSDNWWQMDVNHGAVLRSRRHSEETKESMSRAKIGVPSPKIRGAGNWMFGRRGPAAPSYEHGQTPTRQREYARAEWRETVRVVDARDHQLCQRCGAAKTTPRSMHRHHKRPFDDAPELRCDPDNIVTLCAKCHRWVHSASNVLREHLS